MIKNIVIIILLTITNLTFAQSEKKSLWKKLFSKDATTIKFRQINHNVVIPIKINNSDSLWFILDTGLTTSLITELSLEDSLIINYANKVQLHGLGEGEIIEAYTSDKNDIQIDNIHFNNEKINVLLNDIFFLSKKAGCKINGIIGATVFENYIVEINYEDNKVIFHKPESYKQRKSKRIVRFPIEIINNKPYIYTWINDFEGNRIKVKLLVDTGASLPIWLQENEKIRAPENHLYNIIGQGLSGNIYGKIGRIKNIEIGKYIVKEPITNFPDSSALNLELQNDKRNGSIGGDLLRRFNIIIDYPNKQICFTKNKYFKKEFEYNNSGIDIETPFPSLKVYVISNIMKDSPAEIAGFKVNDQILRINKKNVIHCSLRDVYDILSSTNKKTISITILRDGKTITLNLKTRKLI